MSDSEDYRPDESDGYDVANWESMDEGAACSICGGSSYTGCSDPLECMQPHLGGKYRMDGGDVCPCRGCGGSGAAKDQTLW